VEFLTEPGDLVVDIFAGSNTTGQMAEAEGRHWISFEIDQREATNSALRFLGDLDEADALAAFRRLAYAFSASGSARPNCVERIPRSSR
jgi:site-specific DNA-methyltransferase (cytosine-N4-specific)